MLEIERAGEEICALSAVKPGDQIDAASECKSVGAGESRSDSVRHPTAGGVAI